VAGRLEGKIALISGGARGMGACEAARFVEEGARVVIGDVLDEEGQRTADAIGEACAYVHLDVTQEEQWQAAIEAATGQFGALNVLVNNAGILRAGPIETTSLEDFEQILRINLSGTFLGVKTAIPALRAAGGGSIVNISSIAGLVGVAGAPGYVASKHGVHGLSRAAALELGRDGIRVNSIHPGGVDTPMTQMAGVTQAQKDAAYKQYPLGRVGEPEDIAHMVVFLASDESAYCSGGAYLVDGGALAGRMPEGLGD
jgi:3alpha(or 20beta)-hydroxysteroid dehydrogenase